MIRTLDFGKLPIANDTTYIYKNVVGTVETCNGDFYTVHKSFSGSLVAVKNSD